MMKKLFIFIIALNLFINSAIHAQSYHPVPVNNANWNEVFIAEQPHIITPYKNVAHNDTIIQNKKYGKFYLLNTADTCIHNPPSGKYYAAVRNDTSSKKVYVIFKDSLKASLLYDFSKNVGDTIHYYYHKSCWTTLVVTKIDYVQNQGINRKLFSISGWGEDKWIEGIGCTEGFFYPKYALPTCFCHWILGCVYNNDTLLYQNPEFTGECSLTGINEDINSENNLIIKPNPAQNKISISVKNGNVKIENIQIYSLFGKVLIQKENFSSGYEVDISQLPQGVYLTKAVLVDGRIYSKKLVVY